MTNFKEYFTSHIRANLRAFIFIFVTVWVLTFLLGINMQPTEHYDYKTQTSSLDYSSTLYVPVSFLCILSYVIPVMEFSFFKKRINLDCAYSLPISRRGMGIVHYLTGLIILLGAFTSSYLINFILLLSRGPGWFDFTPLIGHYLICLILGFAQYSLMVFVFNQANTHSDGMWFMTLYSFLLSLIIIALDQIIDADNIMEGSGLALSFGTISTITSEYQPIVELESYANPFFWQDVEIIGWFIFWVVVGIASTVGLFLTFGKRRMEKTEEVSDSYFGYRTLIPIYAISGMIAFTVWEYAILWVIIELIALLGYTIYRRGFHYKKSDIIALCSLLIFLFI